MNKKNQLLLSLILILSIIVLCYALYLLNFLHNSKLAENEKLLVACRNEVMVNYGRAYVELMSNQCKDLSDKTCRSEVRRLTKITKDKENQCEKKFPVKKHW